LPEFPNRNASESHDRNKLRRLPPTTPSALHIGRHFPRWLCQATGTVYDRRSASTEKLAGVSLRVLERRVLPSKRPSPYATYADTAETKVVSSLLRNKDIRWVSKAQSEARYRGCEGLAYPNVKTLITTGRLILWIQPAR
jgi:hypothetical protein